MGVKGLLPGLQDATQSGSIGSFNGTRVAIDASGWLHKGLYTAAEDYVDSGTFKILVSQVPYPNLASHLLLRSSFRSFMTSLRGKDTCTDLHQLNTAHSE
jgi:hypothetical protein